MKPILFSVLLLMALAGCHSHPAVSDRITGVYARQYSFDQVNLETSTSIGKVMIRDTIFIVPAGNDFKVSNSRWRKNSYDRKGWYKLGTNSRGAFHAYAAKWNEADGTLSPVDFGVMKEIRVDQKNGVLFLGEARYREIYY